jgi:hypothetical protein
MTPLRSINFYIRYKGTNNFLNMQIYFNVVDRAGFEPAVIIGEQRL